MNLEEKRSPADFHYKGFKKVLQEEFQFF